MAHVIIWNSLGETTVRSLGPYQLASWLRHNGYTVKVIDFCNLMTIDQLVAITEKHVEKQTLTIGVSGTFWKNKNWPPKLDYEYIEPTWVSTARSRLEEKYPSIQWSMGGAQAYLYKSNKWITFNGHAENIYLDWLDHLSESKHIHRQTFDIKNACQVFQADDFIMPYEVLPVELGRGCMFKCKFCAYDLIGKTPGTYLKNYNLVEQEIRQHNEQWGTTRFSYVDDTVNESVEKVSTLANIANRMLFQIEWSGYIRADLIWAKPETEQLLIDSGLKSAFFGIESFEESSSKLVGKGWSGKHGKDWLLEKREQWNNKLVWELGMVVGIPGQTPDQLRADCQWLIDNDMYSWWYFPLWMEPGYYQSEFSKNSSKYGFTFPDKSRPWYWENSDWNFDIALAMYTELENHSKDHRKIGGWGLGEVATLGYEFDYLLGMLIKDLPYSDMRLKRNAFIENYVRLNLES